MSYEQREAFFESEPTIERPDNLQRAADPTAKGYSYSAQWQTLDHVVWLQRVAKVKKALLIVPNIPFEPVIGEPRHVVHFIPVPCTPHAPGTHACAAETFTSSPSLLVSLAVYHDTDRVRYVFIGRAQPRKSTSKFTSLVLPEFHSTCACCGVCGAARPPYQCPR